MHFLGVDLAWGVSAVRPANETGLVLTDSGGAVVAAGWARGLDEVLAWIAENVPAGDVLAFVDASLLVDVATGQRRCETEVGQRYGRWKVSANSTNLASEHVAGTLLRERLEALGWRYDDGLDGPPARGRVLSECYPYTTLVGAAEFGYDRERPRYKRPPKGMPAALWQPLRAQACDELIARTARLTGADPPLDLRPHPATAALLAEPSPLNSRAYKHREDLLDAALCAWTAALWHRHGLTRCQVLGAAAGTPRPAATIIAPARPEQRRPSQPPLP